MRAKTGIYRLQVAGAGCLALLLVSIVWVATTRNSDRPIQVVFASSGIAGREILCTGSPSFGFRAPLPLGTLKIFQGQTNVVRQQFKSSGRYEFILEPGTYRILFDWLGPQRRFEQKVVVVKKARFTLIDLGASTCAV